MSDPQKNFMCIKCGAVVNDMQRNQGKDTPCMRCILEALEWEEWNEIQKPLHGKA